MSRAHRLPAQQQQQHPAPHSHAQPQPTTQRPARFHVAPEQAALRAQAVHPDASRGRFNRRTGFAPRSGGGGHARALEGSFDAESMEAQGRQQPMRARAGSAEGAAAAGAAGVRMVKMSGRKDSLEAGLGQGQGQGQGGLSPSPLGSAGLDLDNEGEEDLAAAAGLLGEGDDDEDDDGSDGPPSAGGSGGGGGTNAASAGSAPRKARYPNKRNAQSVGRRKIHIEFIEDKPRRHVTFTKRKSGLMKKAYELSTLTGTDCLVVVVSESGLLYTFSTPALSGVTDHPKGRDFLEAALRGDIRGDGTGDLDFEIPDGGGATGGGAGNGSARARRGRSAAAGDESAGRLDVEGAGAGDGGATGAQHCDFQLDPTLGALDLPVPPLPYSSADGPRSMDAGGSMHLQHPSLQPASHQPLYDLFGLAGSPTANYDALASAHLQQQQDLPPPEAHSGLTNDTYPSFSTAYFDPSSAVATASTSTSMSMGSLGAFAASNFAPLQGIDEPAPASPSLFDPTSLAFPSSAASPSANGLPALSSAPATASMNAQEVARAHEAAAKSYRLALDAAEGCATPPAAAAGSSSSSSGGGGGGSAVGRKRSYAAGATDASELGWERSVRPRSLARGHSLSGGAESAGGLGAAPAAEATESAEERKVKWRAAAREALDEANQSPTVPSFLRAHAFSHYASRPYPPAFDPSKPLYTLSEDNAAMMQASFARMCCRGAVEDQGELAGALEEFLARWLPREMLRNPHFQPNFLSAAVSAARPALLSLLDFLEGHDLLGFAEAERVGSVLRGQVRVEAGWEEVRGLGAERGERLYGLIGGSEGGHGGHNDDGGAVASGGAKKAGVGGASDGDDGTGGETARRQAGAGSACDGAAGAGDPPSESRS